MHCANKSQKKCEISHKSPKSSHKQCKDSHKKGKNSHKKHENAPHTHKHHKQATKHHNTKQYTSTSSSSSIEESALQQKFNRAIKRPHQRYHKSHSASPAREYSIVAGEMKRIKRKIKAIHRKNCSSSSTLKSFFRRERQLFEASSASANAAKGNVIVGNQAG